MLARTYAPAPLGLDNRLIVIECDVTAGLPGLIMVGLGDKAVDEARERVRSAIKNSGLALPPKRLTLNLAPADLPKDGAGYDLGIAVAVLAATGQLRERLDDSLFFGELALDGELRPVHGALLAAQLAADHGRQRLYVPAANAAEAALPGSVDVIGVRTLGELFRHLTGLEPLAVTPPPALKPSAAPAAVDLADIYGQDQAKRALEIAAAGGHNLLLTGPPGTGKTMLAQALIGLLPPPSFEEMLEITRLTSLTGRSSGIVTARPFRAPHHSASSTALVGGGRLPRPGEISLSHRGVLFLDELPEFPRGVLELLRQPLEDRSVTIARAAGSVRFPADLILVATANPCPCGYYGDSRHRCRCSLSQINHYRQRLSGPLLDRIDLVVEVGSVDDQELGRRGRGRTSKEAAAAVADARRSQLTRFDDRSAAVLNARLTNADLHRLAQLSPAADRLAREATASLGLSARAYTRTLKVARTIADLAGTVTTEAAHLSEALHYRRR